MAVDRPVTVTFSLAEADALLWAVRRVPLEDLRHSPYHGVYDRASGYGALSSATNRLEAALGGTFVCPECGVEEGLPHRIQCPFVLAEAERVHD